MGSCQKPRDGLWGGVRGDGGSADLARGQGLCLFPSGLETRLGQTQGEGEEARGLRPGKAECEAALRGLLVGKGQGGGGKALSESWGQMN